MAPEIFKKQGHGKPVDSWALGVIAYFLLCGERALCAPRYLLLERSRLNPVTHAGYTPFDRDSQVDEIQAICSADFAFEPAEYWADVSPVGALAVPCSSSPAFRLRLSITAADLFFLFPLPPNPALYPHIARDFVTRCLTVDQNARLTAHQALQHPWLVGAREQPTTNPSASNEQPALGADLLPTLKKFDPKKTFRCARFYPAWLALSSC